MPPRGADFPTLRPMPALSAIRTMNTDEVAARDRVPFWQDWIRRVFSGWKPTSTATP